MKPKNLAADLMTCTLMTASLKALQYVCWIWYPVLFQVEEIRALIDFSREINTMTPVYAIKLGFSIQKTSIGVQKMDSLLQETHGIAFALLSL